MTPASAEATPGYESVSAEAPFGRPSPASSTEPKLRSDGHAAKADWRADGAGTEWCTVRAASVVGVRHRLAGRGSDDSYAWSFSGDRLVVAVADGVGSVEGSAELADSACRIAVDAVEAGTTVAGALARTNQALLGAAGNGTGATTLVVASITPDGAFELARVGDSSAWLVGGGGPGRELFEPPDADRAGTSTEALPAAEPVVEAVSGAIQSGQSLCLVTDGVADPWRDGPSTVAPALEKALCLRPGPAELLSLVDFSRQGCHDDRTLLAVRLRQPAG